MAGDDFAGLLRELKERSGLSYGTLGKRLHMSASTLHRYVSGEVVPVEFAPVERMARLCRATPEELLELHRRWIRADALRGMKEDSGAKEKAKSSEGEKGKPSEERKAESSEEGGSVEGRGESAAGGAELSEGRAEPAGEKTESAAGGAESAAGQAEPADKKAEPAGEEAEPAGVEAESGRAGSVPPAGVSPGDEEEAVTVVGDVARSGTPAGGRRLSRRTALYAGTAVALVVAVALGATLLPDGGTGRDGSADAAGATVSHSESPSPSRTARSASPSKSASAEPSASASASAKKDEPKASPSASRGGNAGGSTGRDGGEEGGVPITVQTTPYYWESPCEQSFLVDRSPQNMPPPPSQQSVVGWVTPLGAVAADRQMVALTVQGTGEETVVVQGLHLRVASSGAPLDWKKYAAGVGCGGEVATKSFDASLDLGDATVTPINGQRNFPYSVTESDPEVFYVDAHTSGRDVRWYLELDWSSGSRKGTIRIDDHGKPFRTSASKTEYYGYMLGGNTWEYFEGT
ncbi:helix-turn-helix domain-containing protein [Streptomyces sp. NPDC018964]|uniref:helix-turn-helix domain-containing protein n=1 Tax=Streptomyces sp. NPDC018964 TaxID=3365058 RepID=UPI0037ADE693